MRSASVFFGTARIDLGCRAGQHCILSNRAHRWHGADASLSCGRNPRAAICQESAGGKDQMKMLFGGAEIFGAQGPANMGDLMLIGHGHFLRVSFQSDGQRANDLALIAKRVHGDNSGNLLWVDPLACTAFRIADFKKQAKAHLLHRAFAALAAIWDRLRGLRASALAAPPLSPPRRPRATAWGFLAGFAGLWASGLNFGACPVDSSMIWYASWLGSRGRFFDRSSMTLSVWMQVGCQCQAFTELRTDQLSIRAERGSRIMRLPSMWEWRILP